MRLLKENLLVQFSVVSLIAMVIIAVVFVVFLSNIIQSHAVDALVEEAIADSSGRLLQAITPADLKIPMTGERYDSFHKFVQESIVSERTARVKLWAKDGTVIYSNDPASVGGKFPDNENLLIALRGDVATEIKIPEDPENERERFLGTLIEVYTPIIFSDTSGAQGAFEIYQYYQPTAQLIANLQRRVLLSTAVVFLLLYGTSVGIVWGGVEDHCSTAEGTATSRGGKRKDRIPTPRVTEDGGSGPVGRRSSPRLQQFADGDYSRQ